MIVNGTANVYKLRHVEGDEWLLPVDSNDYDLLNFDGKLRGSSWKPILMQRLKTDDGRLRRPCDFPCGAGGGLAMTEARRLDHVYGNMESFSPSVVMGGDFGSFK